MKAVGAGEIPYTASGISPFASKLLPQILRINWLPWKIPLLCTDQFWNRPRAGKKSSLRMFWRSQNDVYNIFNGYNFWGSEFKNPPCCVPIYNGGGGGSRNSVDGELNVGLICKKDCTSAFKDYVQCYRVTGLSTKPCTVIHRAGFWCTPNYNHTVISQWLGTLGGFQHYEKSNDLGHLLLFLKARAARFFESAMIVLQRIL